MRKWEHKHLSEHLSHKIKKNIETKHQDDNVKPQTPLESENIKDQGQKNSKV